MQAAVAKEGTSMLREDTERALRESSDGYVRQKSQKLERKEEPNETQASGALEEIIQDLVMRAKVNDKLFKESQVSEEQIEDSLLYYHIVQGDTINIQETIN